MRRAALDGAEAAQFSGRLIGGCIDTLMHLAGSHCDNVPAFIAAEGGDGAILYLEHSSMTPTDWVRALHRLRWAGWLDGLAGVLIGRSNGPDTTGAHALRYDQALQTTLGGLSCPVLINGALAELRWSRGASGSLRQVPA